MNKLFLKFLTTIIITSFFFLPMTGPNVKALPLNVNIYLPLIVGPYVPPGTFSKTTPANAATGQPTKVTLVWGKANPADSYDFCIDAINDNICNTSWYVSTLVTSRDVVGMSANTTYYWQVRVHIAATVTEANAGAWWSFKTGPDPFAIPNGNFEDGTNVAWTTSSTNNRTIIGTKSQLPDDMGNTFYPAVGTYMVRLGGFNYDGYHPDTSELSQTLTFPNVNPLYLVFYYQIRTSNGTDCTPYYGGTWAILINGVDKFGPDSYFLCPSKDQYTWKGAFLDVSAYAGQTVPLLMRVEAPSLGSTYLYLDYLYFSQTP